MDKLNAFIGQFVTDLGAAVHAGMVVIGEKLGLYKALAQGPMTSAQLAAKTKTDERYVREWLASQAAGGYITYDAEDGEVQPDRRTSVCAGESKTAPHICPEHSNSPWVRWRRCRGLPSLSAPAPAWAGMNMPTVSFMDAKSSSVRAMPRIS